MHKYTLQIRDFINHPRRQFTLYQNRALWLQLCSSLDVIGDADLAIDAYTAGKFETDWGSCYLALYGLLQALFLQQDAVFHLCESLGIPETLGKHLRLKEIREIRNVSIGHPTKKDFPKSEPTSYHFIARATLDHSGFELLSYYNEMKSEFRHISTSGLIKDQRSYIAEILTSVIGELKHRDQAHKEQFKMEKLALLFPGTLSYHFGNVSLSIDSSKPIGIGLADLEQIKRAVIAFREALARRGVQLETYSLSREYEDTEYALAKVEAFFQSLLRGEEPPITAKDASIYTFFLDHKVAGLKQTAQEIDEEYSA